jgi:hypothetical protein
MMAALMIEEARIRAALANPTMRSADVRREADCILAVLDAIEFERQRPGCLRGSGRRA